MTEQFKALLWLNVILSLIPIIVGIGVRMVLTNIRAHREEFQDITKDVAVLKAQREEDRAKIERLQDFQNHISERG